MRSSHSGQTARSDQRKCSRNGAFPHGIARSRIEAIARNWPGIVRIGRRWQPEYPAIVVKLSQAQGSGSRCRARRGRLSISRWFLETGADVGLDWRKKQLFAPIQPTSSHRLCQSLRLVFSLASLLHHVEPGPLFLYLPGGCN